MRHIRVTRLVGSNTQQDGGSHPTFAQANIDKSQDDSRDDSEGNQSLSKPWLYSISFVQFVQVIHCTTKETLYNDVFTV